jgi:hypothetical protein
LRALEAAERHIEAQVSAEDCRTASQRVFEHYSAAQTQEREGINIDLAVAWASSRRPTGEYPVSYARYTLENSCRLGGRWIDGQPLTEQQQQERAQQAALLRDVFGNPFSPVTFSPDWSTDTAVSLARQMYDTREFGAMPILADALQDAGCDSDEILSHCRGAGPHVRGCWVVDLVLDRK